ASRAQTPRGDRVRSFRRRYRSVRARRTHGRESAWRGRGQWPVSWAGCHGFLEMGVVATRYPASAADFVTLTERAGCLNRRLPVYGNEDARSIEGTFGNVRTAPPGQNEA